VIENCEHKRGVRVGRQSVMLGEGGSEWEAKENKSPTPTGLGLLVRGPASATNHWQTVRTGAMQLK
jgi:hypothetical protein